MGEHFYDLHAFVDPYTVLVISTRGVLRKIDCPFRVLCIEPVGAIPYNTTCYVDRVIESEPNKLYYMIEDSFYHHTHFRIYVAF